MTTSSYGSSNSTLAIVGCGTLGTAILEGILDSLTLAKISNKAGSFSDTHGNSTPTRSDGSNFPFTRFIAYVTRHQSANRIQAALARFTGEKAVSCSTPNPYQRLILTLTTTSPPCVVSIVVNDLSYVINDADTIILACKPNILHRLAETPVARSKLKKSLSSTPSSYSHYPDYPFASLFHEKLVISLLASTSLSQLRKCFLDNTFNNPNDVAIIRALPNTACRVRQSMTLLAYDDTDGFTQLQHCNIATTIFRLVGQVTTLPEKLMPAGTALSSSGPAFCALWAEALIDGALAQGLPRDVATQLAIQTMQGVVSLMRETDTHPAIIRNQVCTPAGCTVVGLAALEDAAVRAAVARALRDTTKFLLDSAK